MTGAPLSEVLESPAPIGVQDPRVLFVPPGTVSSAGPEAIDLIAAAGQPLDPWQQIAVTAMLSEDVHGRWAAFEFGLQVQRQNGKGAVEEARELAGLFLFGEPMIIHSAHKADTSDQAFTRMRTLIDGCSWLSRRVTRILQPSGRQRIELRSGATLSYRTRTADGGRGFSAPTVILDEAQALTAAQLAAIMPVVSAQPNPQIVYAGTVKAGATVFRGVVERGRQGKGSAFGFAGWFADSDADSRDPAARAAANPALGIRLREATLEAELEAMLSAGDEQKFREEILGIWPEAVVEDALIGVPEWIACLDPSWKPKPETPVEFGVAVAPDRSWGAVGAACRRPDGRLYVELVAFEKGADWLPDWCAALRRRRKTGAFVIDQVGPAATLLGGFTERRIPVRVTATADWKTACAVFVDAVGAGRVAHRGQVPLDSGATGVRRHDVGDSWVYARRDSPVVVAPVEAVTLAAWSVMNPSAKRPFAINLAAALGDGDE